ncbi:SurA N-terminal domain-containing protein [Neptunomonas phycophila]|uniref:Periplasmic chaperone PpiD n=1 Tax=Neptunomonas phycophila TaxID=1572645 RepID=A0AAW7XIZ5_9GAMM|nr:MULTISPECIES: SurA N-terminal domain-containing protein [Neptunomonas]MDN2661630.1 SurA N-terminal domain-containing protein [Neptunomonas sp. CHC150]MDO6454105.1 SurA N-terminal domain-containing protein [Neptunomonas phycophila]MDP2523683.1 SurA N-terminal domain-containing protein [Neptunomonas phycophila]
MLQSIRDNSQGIVAKVIVGLIVVTFALFGVESLVSLTAGSNAPASVNGEEITEQELYQATQIQRRQLLSQMGENANPALLDENVISGMVLESLIEQKALLISAQDKGLYVSDRMLDQMIIETPDFQIDGKFNSDQFQAVLRNAGLTPLMYRDLMRKERILAQEANAYQLSSFVVPAQLKQVVDLETQTRSGNYFTMPLDIEAAKVAVTDDEIKARYDQERSSLTTPEQVVIEYIVLDKQAMRDAITVTDEELQSEYQQRQASFAPQNERHVAHILVEISPDQDDEAALAKAESIKSQLDQGAAFDELAKAESDDIGSAQSGGDLGNVTTGMLSEPFDNAMLALKPGDVSEPVRTEFGYHIIKLISETESTMPSFEELKRSLEDDIVTRKVESEYVEGLEQLADTTYSAGDLAEPSEVMGLPIEVSAPFDRSGGADVFTSNAQVIEAAFADEQLNEGLNSTPIEIDQDRTMVLRVKDHFEPRELSLEEVSDQLRDQIAYDNASKALNEKADSKLAALNSGTSLSMAADDAQVNALESLSRSASSAPAEVVGKLFAMPHPDGAPTASKAVLADGSVAVIQLTAVTQSEAAENEDTLNAMGQYLASMKGQEAYKMVAKSVTDSAEIERK